MKKLFAFVILALVFKCGEKAASAVVTEKLAITVQIGDDVPLEKKIVFGFFGEAVPKTVRNFVELCLNGVSHKGKTVGYKNSPFHRVIPNFMIQGGDFTNQNGTGGKSIYGERFEDENFKVEHDVGVLSMANAGPNTNGSQFFITTAQTPWLNGKHVVFGRVVDGMEAVYTIEKEGTSTGKTARPVVFLNCEEVPMQTASN